MNEMQNLFGSNTAKIVLTVVLIILIYSIRTFINKMITKRTEKIKDRYIARQINNYVVLLVVIILVIVIWFEWLQSIFTFLSIAVAAIIIVSKELLLNLIAHGVIITRELFEAGDRIQVGTYSGDVMETGPVFFTISEVSGWTTGDEASGRVIKIPNSLILTNSVANYSRGLGIIWNEIGFDLLPESNFSKAKSIALKAAEKNSYQFSNQDMKMLQDNSEEIMFITTAPSVKVQIREGLVKLLIRYPCKFHKRNQTEQNIIESFLSAIKEQDDIKMFQRQNL